MFETRQLGPYGSSFLPAVDDRWIAVAAYVGGFIVSLLPRVGSWAVWLVPLVLLLIEKNSRLVRFSAAQSLLISLAVTIIQLVTWLLMFTIILIPIVVVVRFAVNIVYWALIIVAAVIAGTQRAEWRIPLIGTIADRWAR